MKNKLSDLNNHLFAQLERLGEEDLTTEQIEKEVKRGEAMVAVSDQLIKSAAIQLQAARLVFDAGGKMDPMSLLPMIEGRAIDRTAIESKAVKK
jgi:hypothetical protein